MMMTTEELKEIRDRADAATPGEWVGQVSTSHYGKDQDSTDIKSKWGGDYGVTVAEEADCDGDWQFIANARADIPKLLDEIDRLKDKLVDCRHTNTNVDIVSQNQILTRALEVAIGHGGSLCTRDCPFDESVEYPCTTCLTRIYSDEAKEELEKENDES